MVKEIQRSKGPWVHRFAIRMFSCFLAILFYWLLGFLMHDINRIDGPSLPEIEEQYLDKDLQVKSKELDEKVKDIESEIKKIKTRKSNLGDGSRSLQQTIGQLIELQKLGKEKNVAMSPAEEEAFGESLSRRNL